MIFEIHITGDKSIHEICKQINIKTINVCLLAPNQSAIRCEDMTSFVFNGTEADCYRKVLEVAGVLQNCGVPIYRMKIESPIVPELIHKSLYVETHFKTENIEEPDHDFRFSPKFTLPTSRNTSKDYYLATDREYRQDKYDEFINKYKGKELELCILDTNIEEDSDWFDCYS